MNRYLMIALVLNYLVDLLLLMGTRQLCDYPPSKTRIACAACISCAHAAVFCVPGLHFLGSTIWKLIVMLIMSVVAFGLTAHGTKLSIVFIVISLTLRGITVSIGTGNTLMFILSTILLILTYRFTLRINTGENTYVPVELLYREKSVKFAALHDTGNTLRDPLTGQSVLVVGADVANELTGLTNEQLRRPVDTIMTGLLPGLRLIPCCTIFDSRSLLLALRLNDVKIGTWRGASLVAFAPTILTDSGKYSGLTGGCI